MPEAPRDAGPVEGIPPAPPAPPEGVASEVTEEINVSSQKVSLLLRASPYGLLSER